MVIGNRITINPQWYTKKWVTVSLHVLFWMLYFASPYLIKPAVENEAAFHSKNNVERIYYAIFLNNLVRLVIFYVNAYVFIPKVVYRRKYGQYFLILLACFSFLIIWDRFFYSLLIVGLRFNIWSLILLDLPLFIFVTISSTALRVIADQIAERQRIKEKETENLKTELSFLRSQVSPHFMFNVLNNMVALARKKSDLLEPSLIQLSSLLRYMLYETDEDKVLLEKEIEYLESYIELQSQRFGRNVRINTDFGPVPEGFVIEPMLLIPFVENAFKHGTGLIPGAQIDIRLSLEKDRLSFCVRNRYNPVETGLKDRTSGIGLNNVKRRLNLLYPDSHTLTIGKEDGWFSVLLQLNLH